MKVRLSSVPSPSLVLNLLHRYAEEENTRSASTEVGFLVLYWIPGLVFKSREKMYRDPGIANPRSDVEIFCMAIWLKTDVFVYINNTWDKFSFKGFNPKVGRNNPSDQAIYLGNEASHYEPIISVVRKDMSNSIIISFSSRE